MSEPERSYAHTFTVHLSCGGLRGPTQYGPQGCFCAPEPKWPCCDVSSERDLCRLSGRGTAGGVSRWAWLGCVCCVAVNNALQRWLGTAVLPLGRHSIMYGVSLRVAETAPGAGSEFFAAVKNLSLGWDRLHQFGDAEVQRLVAQLDSGLDEVPLAMWEQRFPPSLEASLRAVERLLPLTLPPATRGGVLQWAATQLAEINKPHELE